MAGMVENPRKLKFTFGNETFWEASQFALVALCAVAIVGFVVGFIALLFQY